MIWLLLTLLFIVVILGVCHWGAGIVLHPPKMSQMDFFPEQFGLRYEKAAFQTADGLTLKGWFIPSPHGPQEKRTLLMCHGWGDNKGELLKMTDFLSHSGEFNLFYFDNRSHGESEGKITTLGYFERQDFDAAMDYLRKEKPWCLKRLGVFGFSMGAAVAALSVHKHPEVKAVVLESPYTHFHNIAANWTKHNLHIPYYPLVMLTMMFLRLRVGKPVDESSPLKSVKGISPRPLLVIGGSVDPLMPESDVRAVYNAAGEPKQLWIVPGATHAKCREAGGLAYERLITGFFDKNL